MKDVDLVRQSDWSHPVASKAKRAGISAGPLLIAKYVLYEVFLIRFRKATNKAAPATLKPIVVGSGTAVT